MTERLGSRRVQGRWGAGARAEARAGRAWGSCALGVGRAGARGARQERQARVRGRRTLSRRAAAARRASWARRQRAAGALAGTAWARKGVQLGAR